MKTKELLKLIEAKIERTEETIQRLKNQIDSKSLEGMIYTRLEIEWYKGYLSALIYIKDKLKENGGDKEK